MRNIVLIHGYNGIPKIYEYFEKELSSIGYNVIVPHFPTQTDITIKSYFEVFNRYKECFTDNSIVIAHSIGNELFLKYLCENNLNIELYISLAGFGKPFIVDGKEDLNSVIAPIEITLEEQEKCKNLIKTRFSIYSNNDHIVPMERLEEFAKMINSNSLLIENIGHMGKKSGLESLPEVINIIEEHDRRILT